MQKIILSLFISVLAQITFAQSEISLFDKNGEPIAYIDPKDEWTIYLWEGKPVAYMINDGQATHIYGFNGKHLGWYINGVLRDHDGNIAGFKKGAITNVYEKYEGYKGYKEYKPYKSYREYAPYQPYSTTRFSSFSLGDFLYKGISEENTAVNRQVYKAPDPIMETDLDLLSKVNMQKQALFDQRTKNIQEVINQTSYYLKAVLKYDTAEYVEQYATLKSNADKISTTPVDYSDINQYNQIIIPLKTHLEEVKGKLKILQRHDIIQKRANEVDLEIISLKKVDSIGAKKQDTKLWDFVLKLFPYEEDFLDDNRYIKAFPFFEKLSKETAELTKQAANKKNGNAKN